MLVLVLAVVALIAGIVAELRSRGNDAAGWGVIALALIALLPGVLHLA